MKKIILSILGYLFFIQFLSAQITTNEAPPDKPMRLANRTGGAADKKYPEREKQLQTFKNKKT